MIVVFVVDAVDITRQLYVVVDGTDPVPAQGDVMPLVVCAVGAIHKSDVGRGPDGAMGGEGVPVAHTRVVGRHHELRPSVLWGDDQRAVRPGAQDGTTDPFDEPAPALVATDQKDAV